MGFTAGIYRYNKYNGKSLDMNQKHYIQNYLSYNKMDNSWARDKFKSADEFGRYNLPNPDIEFEMPEDLINFYKDNFVEEEIGYWCSNGYGDINDFFSKLSNKSDISSCYNLVELTKENVIEFLEFCWNKVSQYIPDVCVFLKSFKYIPSGDGEDDDIRLSNCDGIEAHFDDGTIRRFEFSHDSEFCLPKKPWDSWEMSAYIEGIDCALKILKTTDFENECVYYEGGW